MSLGQSLASVCSWVRAWLWHLLKPHHHMSYEERPLQFTQGFSNVLFFPEFWYN